MIYLRELTGADVAIINEWRRDKELLSHLVAPFRYINMETEQKWFDDYLTKRDNNLRCAICSTKTNEIVGAVYLLNIDHVSRSAELGILIGKRELLNKGVGFFAMKLMLDHAFLNLNLHRVYAAILEYNERSIHVAETLGFHREGVLRESVYKDGKYHNQVPMGALKHEYLASISSLGKAKGISQDLAHRNDETPEAEPPGKEKKAEVKT